MIESKNNFNWRSINKLIYFLVVILFVQPVFAQQFTISGRITDSINGEDLVGVTIWEEGSTTGTTTNVYGFYSLTLPSGVHTISYSYIGFEIQTMEVDFDSNKTIDIKLSDTNTELDEVVITAGIDDENIISPQMSVDKFNMRQIEKIPVFMGEKDILKTIQLLPGISSTSEGGSGFSVRGGSFDQNLILLDEAPVYSASHLMGFFSVFNSDALKNIVIYKGGIPANYGGRASSVLDISMKDGNNQKLSFSGGLGLISSRLTVEGPIIKDKMSFIISGRRSYADLVAKGVGFFDDDMNMYFYDLNAKMNYIINESNRVFISGYFGKDEFGFGDVGMDWGNTTGTLRWNHLFNSKLFSNTSIIYSKYDYGFNMGSDASMSSGIEDIGIKEDLTWYINPLNTLKFGFNIKHHTFNPGELLFTDTDVTQILLDKTKAYESATYISNNQKITERLSAEYGLRFSLFNQIGEGWSNTYNENNEKIDSVYYGDGDVMQTYWDIEPRLSMSYQLNESSSVKLSYNRMAQYLHLLSNSTSGQPTDTWVPSSSNIKPQSVSQYAVGYFKNFKDNNFEFSVESYYKDMNNVTDYEDGTDIMLNENIEAYILSGKGRSYGIEVYLKKKFGRFNGWVSYTLARTENKIDGINNDNWYPSKIDKTHDIAIVANYELNSRLSISAAWIYYTGNAVTFPSGKYEYDNQILSYYTDRNSYRMPNYHRLDLNLHMKGKETKKFQSSWDFSLYNAYNRYNAYSISFEESESNSGQTEAVQLSLFGIVPSVTWNFKF